MAKYDVLVYFCTIFSIGIIRQSISVSFSQERAVITYTNPKYCQNASVNTARRGRGAPYFTNITNTIFHTWGNNVSVTISFSSGKGQSLFISGKLCEVYNKMDWIQRGVIKALTYKASCPFKAGNYKFINIEIPHEIPLMHTDYGCVLQFYLTNTKTKLIEVVMSLKHQEEKKKPKP